MRGLVRISNKKGNSVKRSGPCCEPPDSENRKVALPENQLLSAQPQPAQ